MSADSKQGSLLPPPPKPKSCSSGYITSLFWAVGTFKAGPSSGRGRKNTVLLRSGVWGLEFGFGIWGLRASDFGPMGTRTKADAY